MTGHVSYFEYLRKRSWTGLLYRRLWLYPRICKYIVGKVLDVGCGIGDMLLYRPNTIGVDINENSVKYCRSRGLDARLMRPDVLDFPDSSFGGVIMDNVLEHLTEPRRLLAEIRRVLVERGRLLIGVPGARGYASDSDHKIFYDYAALKTLLDNMGFRCIDSFYMPMQSRWMDKHLSQYCLYGVFQRQ
jgi:SAM-dependent methyltransferase